MSLQLAAQHLASKGRGPDTTLVHMTPREVGGLQALARAHGGSLTVNPQTGLPEAGFLSTILPIVAGAALGPAGFGLSAMQAALATGAVGAMATGSLRKGLMAGLGAYGGAGLMGSVAGAGEAALQGAASMPATGVPAVAGAAPVAPVAPAMSSQLAGTAGTNAITGGTPGFGVTGGETMFSQPVRVTPMAQIMQTATPSSASMMTQPGLPAVVDRSSYSLMDKLKAGAGQIASEPSKFFNKENMRYGLAALAPLASQDQRQTAYQGSGPNPYQYAYNPGRTAVPTRAGEDGEYQYFNPSYTRMAEGGTVEAMSARNQQETLLANGGQQFADGGSTGAYNYVYDPISRTYRDVSAASTSAALGGKGGSGAMDAMAMRNKGILFEGPTAGRGSPEQAAADWGNLTPYQQAQFYANNPGLANITQIGQSYWGKSIPGMIQNLFDPEIQPTQFAISYGIDPQTMIPATGGGAYYESPYNTAPKGDPIHNTGGRGSLTGGFLDFSGRQAPAPVVDVVPTPVGAGAPTIGYDPSGFGAYGENAAPEASLGNDVDGFGAYGENVAPGGAPDGSTVGYDPSGFGSYVEQEGTPGVVVGGPIGGSYGDVGVSDIGSYGSAGETAPGGVGFGSDIGYDSGIDAGSGVDVSSADSVAADAVAAAEGYARGGLSSIAAFARGGYSLGDYSDGGRLLRGPGDGVSDSIPATIANKRPARLADGEFVVPARIVSELGNGSTDAGARKLYAMMDRIQKNRAKSVGKNKVAVNSRSEKMLPA